LNNLPACSGSIPLQGGKVEGTPNVWLNKVI
jgi:hypothetical protein